MAEALGIVAGVVGISGFAGQLAGGVLKLTSLYKHVKNADQEVLILTEEIASFASVLEHAESKFVYAQTPIPPFLVKCYRDCDNLVGQLNALIREMEKRLQRQKVSERIRYTFKRDTILELRSGLARAQQTLTVALLTFTRYPENQDTLVIKGKRYQKIARNRANDPVFRVIIPFPWSRKGWIIETTRAYQGWDFAFRVRNMVPVGSLVFRLAAAGDVAGSRAVFEARVASPFDVDENGITPLHYAAWDNQPDMVRFLIGQGADVNARDFYGE
ncbi:MAG: hypothetical protein Q9160_009181 [Pyrenula sp. 1 TL-2023]